MQDLESIVTVLEVAALDLTEAPGDMFTKEQLYERAREVIGPEMRLDEVDLDIVFRRMGYAFQKIPGGWRLK